ncbi:MAG: hypothetical protein LBS98_06655 [Coriobacteriales bacterium]|nr:hypothetical protein [Coriobacteriales bacterium]
MKKRIVAVILTVLMVAMSLGSLVALSGCGDGADPNEKYIVRVGETAQNSNGVDFKNYTIYVNPSFDWANAADDKRQALAEYAASKVASMAKEAGIFNYNIIAVEDGAEDSAGALFQYDRNNATIVLYKNGERIEIPYALE